MKDVSGRSFVGGSGCCEHTMRFVLFRRGTGLAVRQVCRDCGAVCACRNCSGLRGTLVTFLDSDAANYVGGAALVTLSFAVAWWVMR